MIRRTGQPSSRMVALAVCTAVLFGTAPAEAWSPGPASPWPGYGPPPVTCMLGQGTRPLYLGPATPPVLQWNLWHWPGAYAGGGPYWRFCGVLSPNGEFWVAGRVWGHMDFEPGPRGHNFGR